MSSTTTKVLMIIIFMAETSETSTDGSHFHLSGSLNVEKYETVDMKHRLLLKHNTSRREVSSMLVKEDGHDKRQYEIEERFNKDNGDTYTRKDSVWIFPLTVLGGSISYIVYAVAGKTFTIRSWSLNDTTLSFAIKQGDMVRLNASFNAGAYEIIEDKKHRLVLKQNLARREVSLIFDKVGNEDEGQYVVEENFNKSYGDTFTKKDGAWIFRLNVLKPYEIKRSYVGENIIILRLKIKSTSFFPLLYHNDHVVTILKDTGCDVNSTSHFYGRLRCEVEKAENRYSIEIQNVEQNDTGLYRVNTDGDDTERCFLNITVQYTNSANALRFVTPPERSNGVNSDQPRNNTLSPTVLVSTAVNRDNLLSVPIYVIPVIIGAVGIIQFIGCLIWSQWRKINMIKAAEQRIPQVECDPHLYLSPIAHGIPLPVPTTEDRQTGHSNIAQTTKRNSSTLSIHIAQMRSKDGYEEVDISNNDDSENKLEHEEILYESTEHCNTTFCDTSGYLTVMAARETTV